MTRTLTNYYGALTDKSPKSLPRMLSRNGNLQERDLFEIVGCRQEREGGHLEVQAVRWQESSREPASVEAQQHCTLGTE